MIVVNVHEAKSQLSKLLDAVELGEEVYITRRGKGVNRFQLVPAPVRPRSELFGALKGQIHYAEDWDAADKEVLEVMFESIESDKFDLSEPDE